MGGNCAFNPTLRTSWSEGAKRRRGAFKGSGRTRLSSRSGWWLHPAAFQEIPFLHLSAMTYYTHNGEAVSSNTSFTENWVLTPLRQTQTWQPGPWLKVGASGRSTGSLFLPAPAVWGYDSPWGSLTGGFSNPCSTGSHGPFRWWIFLGCNTWIVRPLYRPQPSQGHLLKWFTSNGRSDDIVLWACYFCGKLLTPTKHVSWLLPHSHELTVCGTRSRVEGVACFNRNSAFCARGAQARRSAVKLRSDNTGWTSLLEDVSTEASLLATWGILL